jgi:hypothetical protein
LNARPFDSGVSRLHFAEGANTLRLIFLHGLPGVGKLTVARELARLTGYKLFHNHLAVDLVESVFEFGSWPFVELREMIWLALFSRAAEGISTNETLIPRMARKYVLEPAGSDGL